MTPDELEYWEERAAVFEHQALMPRAQAEKMADEALIAYRMARMEREALVGRLRL